MKVTNLTNGPFAILVSIGAVNDFVVAPDGGFATKEEAMEEEE